MKNYIYPITAIICCVILGLCYYSIQINKQKSQDNKEEMIKNCLSETHQRFVNEGTVECKRLGYTGEEINNLKCILDENLLTRLEKKQKDEQDLCLKLFK